MPAAPPETPPDDPVGASGKSVWPGQTAEQALRHITLACAEDFARHLAALTESDAPEGPHRARIALRQLRTALAGMARLINRPARAAVEAEARRLFRLLGHWRDADILMQHDTTAALAADRAADRAARAAAIRTEVRAALVQAGADRFAPALRARFAGDGWHRRGHKAARRRRAPVTGIARRALRRAWKRCTAHRGGIRAMSDAERHAFRKDAKALRYLSDFFRRLWPGRRADRFRDRLETLQDALGMLNDLATIRARTTPGHPLARTAPDKRARKALRRSERDWRRLRKAGVPGV
ncbi:CHAD domain-containing protein [Paracoccaceae bacterium Fryx2]|nr:CHAD domain-containing protein [Paracoccaceae bacterium Fryx2]